MSAREASRPLVLVVDDFPDGREIVRCVVENLGMSVIEAANGHDGLHRARTHLPDLVVLDLALPGIDGWTIAAELKADPASAGIAILGYTAHAEKALLERARRSGCDALLTKPCPPGILARAIRELLSTTGAYPAMEKNV